MIYELLRENSKKKLERAANKYLEMGWELQGGVTITFHGSMRYYAQAMARKENENI